MHIVPVRERFTSLKCLSHKALLAIVTNSRCKDEEDIQVARNYLSDLTPILRLQLAKDVEDHLRDWHYPNDYKKIYVPKRQRHKYPLWRVACLLPEEKDMPIKLLHVAFASHYTSKALQYLTSEECASNVLKCSNLTFKAGFSHQRLPKFNLSYQKDFNVLISRFADLTVVELGKGCGDSNLLLIGQTCKRLTKLTLSEDTSVTNDGFVSFAQSQKENECLDTIVFGCRDSNIRLLGLAQVWLIPLAVKTLYCHVVQFNFANDDILLECPNGPTRLTRLIIDWCVHAKDEHLIPSAMTVLDCAKDLFPSLQRMDWKSPVMDLVRPGKVWDKVKLLKKTTDGIDLQLIQDGFPQLEALSIGTVSRFEPFSQYGHFKKLRKMSFHADEDHLSFGLFSSLLREIETLRVVQVLVAPAVADEFTDGALQELFVKCKHLRHLEVVELRIPQDYCSDAKLPLTDKTVQLILKNCENLVFLGGLETWSVDRVQLESSLASGRRYDVEDDFDFFDGEFYTHILDV